MDIGHRMKELRVHYGLTQQELADRSELSKGFISQLERNLTSPSVGTLLDIIQCLGTTPAEFFADDEPEQVVVKNEDYFEKVVDMFEAYFKNGGVHFQLTYVSKADLIAAQKDPEKYNNLRVRVTGFSDYFVNLRESIQNDIIERTTHNE